MSIAATPLAYLDRALGALRDLGLVPSAPATHEAPIVGLLQQISDLDQDRVVAITRTLAQASLFNEVVREQVAAMDIGTRYERIVNDFNSIRDDARAMVDQMEDGRISTFERLTNMWMKVTRGDIAQRFDRIKRTYVDVTASAQDQIRREEIILEAYQDFRGALKQAEVLAFEVLEKADAERATAKEAVGAAMRAVDEAEGDDAAARARLELARDEAVRALQATADNLTIGYNTSEVVMARLMQSHTAKERVNAQAVSFFGTNETVLTALTASFTGLTGLHESTRTLEAMKEGVSQSLESLADLGGKVQEEALRAGYGPTIRADAVKRLVDAVVDYQERSREIIEEMRVHSTVNASEIREAVEDGKRRLAKLAQAAAG